MSKTGNGFALAGSGGRISVSGTPEVSGNENYLKIFLRAVYRQMLVQSRDRLTHEEVVEIYNSLFCDRETGESLPKSNVSGTVQKIAGYSDKKGRGYIGHGFCTEGEKSGRTYYFEPHANIVENTKINPAEIAIQAVLERLEKARDSQRRLIQEIRPRALESGEALKRAQTELKRLAGKAADEDVGDKMQAVLERIERIKQGLEGDESNTLQELESWEVALRSVIGTIRGELKKLSPEEEFQSKPTSAEAS